MNIEIKVDEVTLSTIVADVVAYDTPDGELRQEGTRTVGDLVAEQIAVRLMAEARWASYSRQFAEIRQEMIRDMIRPQILEAMSKPIRKTSAYGEVTGEETTLTELIIAEARKVINEPDDRRGYRTFMQKTVAEAVKAALGAEIADAVKTARQQVAGEIGQHVAAAVQAGLTSR